jgi:ATP-dependent Clp protease protease subunit
MKCIRYSVAALLASGVFQGCTILVDPGAMQRAEARIDFSDPVLNQRRILIVGKVTEATAAETIRQLLFLDAQNNQPIDVYLMTPGGDLKAAFAVEHLLQMIRSPVNTYALGECNSGGAVLLAAGTGRRKAFADSMIVVHGMVVKGQPPTRAVELFQESYTAFWRRQARLPQEWLPVPPGKIFILTPEQARCFGVIDEIIEVPKTKAEPGSAANGSQPIRSETNRTSSAAGSRR